MSEIKKIYIEPTILEKYFLKDGEKIIKKDGEYYVKKINNQKVFSLEYDKATLTDMVCELQERIDKALNLIYNEDLSYYPNEEELVKILRGDKE